MGGLITESLRQMKSAFHQWCIDMDPCNLRWWKRMAKRGLYSINVVSPRHT